MSSPQIPTIPTIAPTVSAANQEVTNSDIGQLMAPIVAKANQPIPDPYVQGMQVAAPHVNEFNKFRTDRNTQNKPITMQVADIKRARRQNAINNLANTIGQARKEITERKQASLKDRLVDVMKYKTNVENAQTVLNDPSSSAQAKQMAQKVMDANKKQLNDLLSDPKHVKEMSKALDISFVDPDKNKTPEVQAYQQAMKEFKEAGPFSSDNPQEHAVAVAAQGGGLGQGTQQQAKPAANTPPVPKQSATPYADAALSKDSPAMEVNPRYIAALQQRKDAQADIAKILPSLIKAQNDAVIHAADNTSKEAVQAAKDKAAADRSAAEASARLKEANVKGAWEYKAASSRAWATLKAAQLKNTNDAALMAKDIYNQSTIAINDANKNILDVQKQLEYISKNKVKNPELVKQLNDSMALSKASLQDLASQQYSAGLIMTGNPQGTAIQSLLSGPGYKATPPVKQDQSQNTQKQPSVVERILNLLPNSSNSSDNKKQPE